jgi:hypothetical protein
MGPWQLAGQKRFVDFGSCDAIGDHPDLAEQGQPAGRRRGEKERCALRHPYLNR